MDSPRVRYFGTDLRIEGVSRFLLAGCGSAEKESSETKEVSAKSFADAVEKGSAIQKGDYSVTMNLSLKGDDLELFGSDEEEIMKTLGMKADALDAKLTLSGKIAGTDAMSMKVGVECGKIKGDLTEFILADDTLYEIMCDNYHATGFLMRQFRKQLNNLHGK